VTGPVCKHCRQPILRQIVLVGLSAWQHVATGNVYCANNLPGLTSRFAEPG
jgi:hypothetical protein